MSNDKIIKIGSKIPKIVKYTNCYKLSISYMHGDGDHFEQKDFYIKENDKEELNILKQLFNHLDEFNDVDELEEIVRKYKISDDDYQIDENTDEEELQEFCEGLMNLDYIIYDIRFVDNLATITDKQLTYFDSDGIEYETIIKERNKK